MIRMRMEGYGTDCYPSRKQEKNVLLHDLRDAMLFNPRNCYQNYNVAINCSERPLYTYLGMLKPGMKRRYSEKKSGSRSWLRNVKRYPMRYLLQYR